MEEREIEYKDIRAGDTVRFEHVAGTVTTVRTGTAHERTDWNGWVDAFGKNIELYPEMYPRDRIVLVDRPKRELPEEGAWVRILGGVWDGHIGRVEWDNFADTLIVSTPATFIYSDDIKDFEELVLVPKIRVNLSSDRLVEIERLEAALEDAQAKVEELEQAVQSEMDMADRKVQDKQALQAKVEDLENELAGTFGTIANLEAELREREVA